MFSMMPRSGTFTFWNIIMPLRTSWSATSCGVVTVIASVSGTNWVRVSCASPLPGGSVNHRTTPDDGGIFRYKESHGDQLHPMAFGRSALPVSLVRGLAHAHHHG